MFYVILIISIGFIVYLLWHNASESSKWHAKHAGKEISEEKTHFYGIFFYYNPDDKRIFVPKRSGGGYTINFANPLSIVTVIAIMLAIIIIATYDN